MRSDVELRLARASRALFVISGVLTWGSLSALIAMPVAGVVLLPIKMLEILGFLGIERAMMDKVALNIWVPIWVSFFFVYTVNSIFQTLKGDIDDFGGLNGGGSDDRYGFRIGTTLFFLGPYPVVIGLSVGFGMFFAIAAIFSILLAINAVTVVDNEGYRPWGIIPIGERVQRSHSRRNRRGGEVRSHSEAVNVRKRDWLTFTLGLLLSIPIGLLVNALSEGKLGDWLASLFR